MKNAMKLKLIAALIAVMLLLIFANAKGQGVKISALPTLSAPDSSADYIPIVHSGTTYKVTPGKLFHEFGASGGGGGSLPDTEIGFGTGSGITSSDLFTFDETASILSLWQPALADYNLLIDNAAEILSLKMNNSGFTNVSTLEFNNSGANAESTWSSTVTGSNAGETRITMLTDGSGPSLSSMTHRVDGYDILKLTDNSTQFLPKNTSTNMLQMFELASNGTNYTGFQSPTARSTSLVYTLPTTDPSSGDVMVAGTPGGGVVGLTWASLGAAGSDKQIQFNDGGVFGASSNFTYDKAINRLSVGQILTGGTLSAPSGGKLTLTADYIGHPSDWGRVELDDHLLELHPDGSNSATFGIAFLGTGATNGVTLKAALATGNYTLVWPTAQGSANTFLKNDGSGNLSWATAGGSGTVTSIATTSPITGGTITTTGTIGINDAAADGSTKGAASFTAADFNSSSGLISLDYTNAQKTAADGSTLGFATFTAADFNSSTGLISIDYTNGQAATSGQKGFLTSADWSTFNGKQAAGSYLTADGAVTGAGSQAQVFTSGIETGLIDDNGTGEILVLLGGIDKLGVYTSGVQTVAGSAASPSYSFFTDPTSGLYLKTVESEIGASVDGALVGGFNTAGLFANSISELSAANGVLIDGVQLKDGLIAGQYGGTGVANTGKTITLGGNLTTSGANNVTLTTSGATNVTLPTSGTLVNSAETTLSSLASIGTVTTGSWTASVIAGQYGGTGVANTGKTITLGGNLTTSGAHATTFTTTGTTGVTLPTTGTLATLDGTETFTNKSIVGTQLTGTAYTFAANNTNGTAAYGFEAYERHAKQTYSGTITFNSTVPTSLTSAEYSWSRIGDVVTLTIAAIYASPGATNTTASFTLPSDCPSPVVLAGSGDAANEYTGFTGTGRCEANVTANPTAVRVGMKRNSANTGWEIHTTFGSTSAAHIAFTIVYSVN